MSRVGGEDEQASRATVGDAANAGAEAAEFAGDASDTGRAPEFRLMPEPKTVPGA
jgi:hypothetical protein